MKASKTTRPAAQVSSFRNRSGKPVLLAGPSHTESENQLLETAQQLKHIQDTCIFRAPIWTSSSRPSQLEGVGVTGLSWLKEVQKQTGLRTACEVYNAHQAEEALAFDVDILCLSGLATANPYTIQEMADALRGTAAAVLVSNPAYPDLHAWAGAFERLHQAGLTDLGALHKGFATEDQTLYRNHPKWEHLQQLRQELPGLPVLCDASHIAGKRSLLYPVAQRALDYGLDGLLLETQHTPAGGPNNRQQLMPQELSLLLHALETRARLTGTTTFVDKLDLLRQKIEVLDDTLVEQLLNRQALTNQLSSYGLGNNKVSFVQQSSLREQLFGLLHPEAALPASLKLTGQVAEIIEAVA